MFYFGFCGYGRRAMRIGLWPGLAVNDREDQRGGLWGEIS